MAAECPASRAKVRQCPVPAGVFRAVLAKAARAARVGARRVRLAVPARRGMAEAVALGSNLLRKANALSRKGLLLPRVAEAPSLAIAATFVAARAWRNW